MACLCTAELVSLLHSYTVIYYWFHYYFHTQLPDQKYNVQKGRGPYTAACAKNVCVCVRTVDCTPAKLLSNYLTVRTYS